MTTQYHGCRHTTTDWRTVNNKRTQNILMFPHSPRLQLLVHDVGVDVSAVVEQHPEPGADAPGPSEHGHLPDPELCLLQPPETGAVTHCVCPPGVSTAHDQQPGQLMGDDQSAHLLLVTLTLLLS